MSRGWFEVPKPWVSAVYGGPNKADMTHAYGVNGPATVAVGQSFCSDGSSTGEGCGAKIYGINTCVNVDDHGTIHKACNQAVATATNTTPIVQAGDSGGPVWKLSSRAFTPSGSYLLVSSGSGRRHVGGVSGRWREQRPPTRSKGTMAARPGIRICRSLRAERH